MNQKKNYGFTLIELLAVIVILAIIALIAVPVIMNIINKANESAFKDTAYGVIQAGELYYAEQLLEPNGMTSDVTITLPDATKKLQIKGEVPDGSILITTEGKVAIAVHNNRYCVTKGLEDDKVTMTEDIANCTLPSNAGGVVEKTLSELAVDKVTITRVDGTEPTEVVKPSCITDGTICEMGTPVAIQVNETDIHRFYILFENENKVTLMLDRNIYSSNEQHYGNIPWAYGEDYGCADYDCARSDKGPVTAVKELKERTSGWTNIPERVYTYSDDSGEIDYPSFQETMRARMLTLTELNTINNKYNNKTPDWMLINLSGKGNSQTIGYWLSTPYESDSEFAWGIQTKVIANCWAVYDAGAFGVRPVIELTK